MRVDLDHNDLGIFLSNAYGILIDTIGSTKSLGQHARAMGVGVVIGWSILPAGLDFRGIEPIVDA